MMMRLVIGVLLLACLVRPALAVDVKEVAWSDHDSIWLIEDSTLPMVSVQMAFVGAGSVSDVEGKEGRAYLGSALLTEGAAELDALAFQQALEEKAIRLNISVRRDTLYVSLTTLREHLDTAMRLLSRALLSPRFDVQDVERIKTEQIAGLHLQLQSSGYVAGVRLDAMMYGAHPYGRPARGTPASLEGLSRDDVMAWWRDFVRRDALHVGVSGDVTPEVIAALFDTYLGALPSGAVATPDIVPLPKQGTRVLIEKANPQTVVRFAMRGLFRGDADYYAYYVMHQILGGDGLSARLVDAIRKQRGLAYYANTYPSPGLFGASFEGGFGTRNDAVGEAIAVMDTTFSGMATEGVTQEEVDDAKAYIIGSFPLSLDSNRQLAAYLVSMQLYDLGRDYLKARNAYFEVVTRADVARVGAALLGDGAPHFLVAVGSPAQDAETMFDEVE